MPRQDLLALTADDLIALSNRGTYKRAQREIESGEVSGQLSEEADGKVRVQWSDGAATSLPPDQPLNERLCDCPSTAVCRHLIGAVLLYQKNAVQPESGPEEWDPGTVTDEAIARLFKPAALASLRQLFARGLVIEVHRGVKPHAHFHTLVHTVRFLVPGDLRYSKCDCADPAPCRHAVLAVWAFRMVDPSRPSGLVSTARDPLPIPSPLLAEIEETIGTAIRFGFAQLPAAVARRLEHLEQQCRKQELIWPAEILAELLQQREHYARHDARFHPPALVTLTGELLVRLDSIRRASTHVPEIFVRGSSSDRTSDMGNCRLIGLGCGVQVRRGSVIASTYLQDAVSGVVLAMRREFPDPKEAGQRLPFSKLAGQSVLKGISMTALGASQVLVQGGKRSPNYEFLPGRAPASVNPQSFQWEALRPPVLVEDFEEVRAARSLAPPALLRPRRLVEDFHVCPVAQVEDAGFLQASQAVHAALVDPAGRRATLLHPYYSRGAPGVEHLLSHLGRTPLKFVAGKVRLHAGGLVISPVALIFEENGSRWMLQPWVDTGAGPAGAEARHESTADPFGRHLTEWVDALAEVLLLGLDRSGAKARRHWTELAEMSRSLGLLRLPALADAFAQSPDAQRAQTLAAVITFALERAG